MGAFAIFDLKGSSLLSFIDNTIHRRDNLEQVFKISKLPTDNGMRKILDAAQPSVFQPTFKAIFEHLERLKIRYLDQYLLVGVDATSTFSLCKRGCSQCLRKKRKNPNSFRCLICYMVQRLKHFKHKISKR